jgi:hypothetical protein
MDADTVSIIDTSSLINLYNWRSITNHPTVWQHLDSLIRRNQLLSPEEVYDEISQGKDPLARWATRQKKAGQLFKKTKHQHVAIIKEIVRRFPDFIEANRPTPQADPFVVALALHERSHLFSRSVVITDEKYAPTGRPRIPRVCEEYKLPYMSIHQLFVSEGWTF